VRFLLCGSLHHMFLFYVYKSNKVWSLPTHRDLIDRSDMHPSFQPFGKWSQHKMPTVPESDKRASWLHYIYKGNCSSIMTVSHYIVLKRSFILTVLHHCHKDSSRYHFRFKTCLYNILSLTGISELWKVRFLNVGWLCILSLGKVCPFLPRGMKITFPVLLHLDGSGGFPVNGGVVNFFFFPSPPPFVWSGLSIDEDNRRMGRCMYRWTL